ncbi:MAG TPA: D-alanyl-D-alanine carboxypeptidase family protein [Gaiellaceae bacterium]|nr:D-alanyl-D-alanine carboxypeptidase family protein [Gaiellaceae bacterium]
MRSGWVKSFGSASACALALAGAAHAAATPRIPDARAYYVVNAANGDVLVAHDARARVPIASITKLMTVLVALRHLRPDQVVTVTKGAAQVGESRIPLYAGQRITVHDLLEGALIQSANNAADALAAAAAGGDVARFVGWMNARAKQLGLRDTHFVRPDGLDAPGHVSSARDVAVLAQVAMHLPLVRQIVATSSAPIENGAFTVHTWNDLLGRFPGLIGVKTGHTNAAGWCQVAAARRPGYTIYAVILGEPTRAQRNADLARLLSWGVSEYRAVTLIRPRTYAWAELPYGRRPLALVAPKPLVRVVRRGRPLVEKIVAPTAVPLPVAAGEPLGRVEVWSGKTLVASRPLRAARAVARPGLGGRLGFYAGRTVHDLAGLFR